MDDFFSSAGGASNQLAPVASTGELSNFEAAIGKRFGGASPSNLLTTRIPLATAAAPFLRTPMSMSVPMPLAIPAATPALTSHVASRQRKQDRPLHLTMPPPAPSRTSSRPIGQLSLSCPLTSPDGMCQVGTSVMDDHTSDFTAHTPTDIPSILRSSSSSSTSPASESSSTSNPARSVLLIDIRNHQHFVTSRLHSSVNLSVPSTLLKRPAFGLAKLAEMIPLASDRSAFGRWQRAEHVIVYDADSSTLPAGNNILGLLRKFRIEGFQGQLGYIVGGFNAVARLQPDCVDNSALTAPRSNGKAHTGGALMSHQLPSSAFQQSSTVSVPGGKPTKVAVANPFYDNIRQNLELSTGITERIPLIMPPHVTSRAQELPFQWLRDIVGKASARSADGVIGGDALEDLAMQFYRIELGEQRRLNGVMEHHTNESTTRPGQLEVEPAAFPYSITAGVEKGTKNRYRNIWPFEHARVRLQHPVDNDGTGYINASYIQPRCTALKYIATQGPLAATFTDFWTLVWEQNVGIIVMLTKQIEGHSVKCHCYWKDEQFGPLRLEMVSAEGPTHLENDVMVDGAAGVSGDGNGAIGFDFGPGDDTPASPLKSAADRGGTKEGNGEGQTIRRTFMLSHTGRPSLPPRKIVQLQFLGWPDLNVPSSPQSLLRLIRELDALRTEYRSMGGSDPIRPTRLEKGTSQPGPVLVHCSAGVGRTGSFVIIDAVLNAIRREARMLGSPLGERNRDETDRVPVKSLESLKGSASSLELPPGSSSTSPRMHQSPTEAVDQCGVASTQNSNPNPTVSFSTMPSSQEAEDNDGTSDTRHDQVSVVNLDSRGNEVIEPDVRTVKKRKSASGGTGNGGNGNGLRTAVEALSTAASLIPPPPLSILHFSSGRKAFELDPRKLETKRSSTSGASGNGSSGGSRSASDSVDSRFALRASSSTSTSFGGSSSTAPTSLYSSPHLSSALVSSPMLVAASEVDRQHESRPANVGINPFPPTPASGVLPRATEDKVAAPSSAVPSFSPVKSRSANPVLLDTRPQSVTSLGSEHVRIGPSGISSARASHAPPSSLSLAQSLPDPPEESHSKTHHSSTSGLHALVANISDEPAPDTPITPSTSTSSEPEMAPDGKIHPSKTAMAPSTSMRHPPEPTTTNSVYDYAPPRKLYLSKEIKRNVKVADERAKLAPAALTGRSPQPPSLGPVQGTIKRPPPPPSRVTSPLPHASPNQSSSAVENQWRRGAKSSEDKEAGDVHVTSSDEFSPSSPDLLAEIEEPIRQVLEDMREQRMSLCQSLRQYVFAHLVILEGALAIVDQLSEERVQNNLAHPDSEPNAPPAVQRLFKHPSEKHGTVDGSGFDDCGRLVASSGDVKQVDLISSSPSAMRLSMKRKKRSNDPESPQYEKMSID